MRALNKELGAQSSEAKNGSLRLKNVAFVFFLLFLFFLPLYEAPKNIFSVLFVFLGGWVAFCRENAAQRFKSKDLVVWAFLLLVISPFVAGYNSPYMDFWDRFSSALNWALMPLVGLVMMLVNFSKAHLLWALRCICLGSVIAVGEAFYSWSSTYPELNSVGHVNQSALYLAFCLIPAGLLILRHSHNFDLMLGIAVVLAAFYYQGPGHSMVGFGASLGVIGGMWIIYCWNRKYLKILVGSLVVGLVVLSFIVSQPPQIFGPYAGFKQELDYKLASKNDLFAARDRLVNTAIEVAGDSFVGFGLGSFGAASQSSEIQQAVEASGKDWGVEQRNYASSSHGHNIFANVLVERGWIGVSTLGIFLLYLLIRFSQNLQLEENQIGVLVVTIVCFVGLGQSTLHVEHGQLAFISLALCLVLPSAFDDA